MNQENAEQQSLEIEQEVQDLMKKTDECAEHVDMAKVWKEGEDMAEKLQESGEE